mgnify:CR=1 FL=1
MRDIDKIEWPVAYHGTWSSSAKGIIRDKSFKLRPGNRQHFGAGIYCTPQLELAFRYSQGHQYLCPKDKSTMKEEKEKKIILSN